jgi:isopenicillin N synthase-like dioxygenase
MLPIPALDIGTLFNSASAERAATDKALLASAADPGFIIVCGFPAETAGKTPAVNELLRMFREPAARRWSEQRQKIDAENRSLGRGWITTDEGHPTYNIGPDVAYGDATTNHDDLLRQATPFPPEEILPGWRVAACSYYLSMERIGNAIVRSIARGLGLAEEAMSASFSGGGSTLRLSWYRTDGSSHAMPEVRPLLLDAHKDYAFVTLLAQAGVDGLQACVPSGEWIDIPVVDGTLVVNFGKLLERWTGARLRATKHRVVSRGRERFSVPFFLEPEPDAVIRPLLAADAASFPAFRYRDHVQAASKRYAATHGATAADGRDP